MCLEFAVFLRTALLDNVRNLPQSHLEINIRVIKTDLFHVKIFRVKFVAQPLQHVFILLVLGLFYDCHKLFIAPEPSAIFRRTCSFPLGVIFDNLTWLLLLPLISNPILLQRIPITFFPETFLSFGTDCHLKSCHQCFSLFL